MRQLRSSISAATVDVGDRKSRVSNQSTKSAASFTSFTAAPKQRLQLLDIQLGSVARPKDWSVGKESNKEKKRRRWKEIQRKKKEGQKDETEFRGRKRRDRKT